MRHRAIQISTATDIDELQTTLAAAGIVQTSDHHGGCVYFAPKPRARNARRPTIRFIPRHDTGARHHA